MSRDMKRSGTTSRPATRSGGNGGGGGGSLLTGLVLGTLVGIAVAVGVAFYINRGTNPFMNKTSAPPPDAVATAPVVASNQPEVLRPQGQAADVAPPVASTDASPVAAPPKATASAGERFDFYKMLPAMSDKAEAKAAATAKVKDPQPDATPPATVEAPKGAYLQAGAFQNEQDADNLKAKLALLGIEARIQSVETTDKGIWHRVRIGPFNSVADMDKVRGELQANGVQSASVKAQ